jgi:signal transduction histidine kinase
MPRYVLAIFLGIMLVCGGALAWLGRQVLEQDRTLEAHRVQERLERSADHVASMFARKLLELDSHPPPDGVVEIRGRGNGIEAVPPGRLLYVPTTDASQDEPTVEFAAGEALEFQRKDQAAAAAVYRQMARSAEPVVRAGALLRLGRTLRKIGHEQEALDVYRQLAQLDSIPVLGVPASVSAAAGLCSTLEAMGRRDELRKEAQRFYTSLVTGRWAMSKAVWEFHVNEARRWAGASRFSEKEKDRLAIADAAEWLGAQWRDGAQPTGTRILEIKGLPVLVSWRAEENRRYATITGPAVLRSIWAQSLEGQDAQAALVDADGRIALGAIGKSAQQALRTPAATGLAWLVQVGAGASPGPSALAQRRQLLLAGFAVLALVLLAGSFFILHAMARERAVGRLQSDFVSTVSHEFRTPLTTLLQLSDMLDKGRIPAEDTRREAYRVLYRESERLQRLVESLLDFGRLEAKSFRYRLESLDASEVIRGVVAEFRSKASPDGYGVELKESGGLSVVRADRDALGLAVWNLLDNAVKYSPECRTIWVELDRQEGQVAIRVKDQGLGIPAREQKRIFRKFVRGRIPAERHIKGTGIGLAITRRIVEAHHGQVRLRSAPGQGSTFTILLPSQQTV